MDPTQDALAYVGGAVKATRHGDGTVAVSGLGVVFDPHEGGGADLSGEFFSAKTFFGPAVGPGRTAELEATYNHGFASRPELEPLAEHEFAHPVKAEVTDAGILCSLVLEEADAYEAALIEAAEKGKLRWSSGSAGHRVKREPVPDGRVWLKRWPLVEVALTPTPCEPRTAAVPVKALTDPLDIPLAALARATKAESLDARGERVRRAFYAEFGRSTPSDAWPAEVFDTHVIGSFGEDYYRIPYAESGEEVTFAARADWERVRRLQEWVTAKAAWLASRPTPPNPAHQPTDTPMDNETKATESVAPETKDGRTGNGPTVITPEQIRAEIKAGFDALLPEVKAEFNVAPPVLTTGRGDTEAKALAAFFKTGDVGGVKGMLVGDNRVEVKASNATDMNITTDADGRYAVPTGHFQGIIARRDESMLARKLGVRQIPGVGTTVNVPIDAEDDGEFVATNENTENDLDAPALGQVAMTLVRYTKRVDLSSELLVDEDSRLLPFIEDFVGRGMAKTHNSLLVTEVEANGSDLGSWAAAAAVDAGKLELAIHGNNVAYYLDDSGSVAFVMRPPTYGALLNLAISGERAYSPTNLGSGPGQTRNVLGYPVEFSSKVDAVGASGKSVLFGNWYYVGIREAPSFEVLRDPYSRATHGQVRLHYSFRTVYKVLQAEAIGYIDHPSA